MASRSSETDEIWGTWEDLLLACAVNRHGTSNWDSVASEIQSRSSVSHLLTSTSCRLRFLQLHRRFAAGDSGEVEEGRDLEPSDAGGWVEELRKIRVAELRREVERYDLSIVSLELKVNRLKDEREKSVKESDPSAGDAKQDTTVEDRKDDERSPLSTAAEISSRSCKESNSTDLKEDQPKPLDDRKKDLSAGEIGKRGGESGESSDVQSSASLSTRRRKDFSTSDVETENKSQPLIEILEMIRSDKSGSVFERRLESQETERYKNMIKRHVDLETIRSNLELHNSPSEFFRDLLLLCTNALIFFPKLSPEYSAASNLRSLVNKKIASTNLLKPHVSSSSSSSQKEAKLSDIPIHKPDPDSNLNPLLEKPTIIMCRKRSSLSKPVSQTGSSSGTVKEERERITPNAGLISDPDPNIKKIGATRGPRTSKTRTNTTLHTLNPNPNSDPNNTSKPQKQVGLDKGGPDKKRHAADFLNRLNQSGPATSSTRVSEGESKRAKSEGKKGSKKSVSPAGKRNVGRPPKRPGSSVTPPPSKRYKEEGSKKRGSRR